MKNVDPQDAVNKVIDTYRERLIWQYHHETMMEEFRREQLKAVEIPWDSWEYRRLDQQGERHYRSGQALMQAWLELNKLDAETNRAYWAATHAAKEAEL